VWASNFHSTDGPESDSCREAIATLCDSLLQLDAPIETMLLMNLPQQIIHGDLHYDNVLCDATTGEVTGLLDFEFCTVDWRAMEVAVCLSKYVGEANPFPLVESFIDGYCEHGELTEDECRGLPT
jgi:homoserine kinase type II